MNPLQLSVRSDLKGFLLTGADSAAALDAAGLPCPEMLHAAEAEGALVARTGRDEYLAFLPVEVEAPRCAWCFERPDRVLALQGARWIPLMAQLCQYDFRKMQPGGWMMASVAGVNCWLYRSQSGEGLLIGCDAGFADYLEETLATLVNELDGKEPNKGGAL